MTVHNINLTKKLIVRIGLDTLNGQMCTYLRCALQSSIWLFEGIVIVILIIIRSLHFDIKTCVSGCLSACWCICIFLWLPTLSDDDRLQSQSLAMHTCACGALLCIHALSRRILIECVPVALLCPMCPFIVYCFECI